MAICKQCNSEFKGRNRKGRRSCISPFCSKKCYWNSMKLNREFTCLTCGIKFKPKSHGKTYKYCSKKCQPSWNKGTKGVMKAWNKGKSAPWAKWEILQTPEVREKARLSKIGKPSMLKGKPRLDLRGINNPRWKGGMGSERHQAMGKIEYKIWRHSVFARDKWICTICKEKGGYLHADHIKPWSDYPELRYALNNGRTLCEACHYFITFGKIIPNGVRWGRLQEVKINVE